MPNGEQKKAISWGLTENVLFTHIISVIFVFSQGLKFSAIVLLWNSTTWSLWQWMSKGGIENANIEIIGLKKQQKDTYLVAHKLAFLFHFHNIISWANVVSYINDKDVAY